MFQREFIILIIQLKSNIESSSAAVHWNSIIIQIIIVIRNEIVESVFDATKVIVIIENYITFPAQGRKNAQLNNAASLNSGSCLYSPEDNPHNCPKFRIGDMVKLADPDTLYEDLAESGAIIKVLIDWETCSAHNLEKCRPNYSFHRLGRGPYSIRYI